jgi:hypothetical protein
METLPQRHGTGRFLALVGTARHPNYWIAAADFGKQVARSFQLDEAANREFVIQGPAPLTYDEAGRRFAQQTRPRRLVFKIPLSLVKALGAMSQAMNFNARIMRRGPELSGGVQGRGNLEDARQTNDHHRRVRETRTLDQLAVVTWPSCRNIGDVFIRKWSRPSEPCLSDGLPPILGGADPISPVSGQPRRTR